MWGGTQFPPRGKSKAMVVHLNNTLPKDGRWVESKNRFERKKKKRE